MARPPVRVLAALLAAALLGGCRLEVRTVVALGPRGDGAVSIEIALDDDLAERVRAGGAEPLLGLDDVATPGWTATPLDGRTGVRLAADFGTGRLDDVLDALQEPLDAGTGRLVEDLHSVRADDGTVRLTGTLGLVVPEVVGVAGPGAPTADDLVALAAADPASYRYVLEVVAPTRVLAHDADRVLDGGRLQWDVALGDRREVDAHFAAAPAVSRPLLFAGAGAALLVAVVALVAVRGSEARTARRRVRRHRRRSRLR